MTPETSSTPATATPSASATPVPTSCPLPASTPAPASGTQPAAIEAYTLSSPEGGIDDITTGPDGALWYVWGWSGHTGLGSITTAGVSTDYTAPLSTAYGIDGLAAGVGCLWTVETVGSQNYIGQWTTAGVLQHQFPVPGAGAYHIAWGPDGALWFTGIGAVASEDDEAFIGRMTTAGQVTTYPLLQPQDPAFNIVSGPDGALWFDIPSSASVGEITTSGTITVHPIPGASQEELTQSQALVEGPDGALWVAWGSPSEVVRISAAGSVTDLPVACGPGPGGPSSIASGSDEQLWVTASNEVCSVSTSGTVTAVYSMPGTVPAVDYPTVITSGPDGDLWFGFSEGYLCRLDPSIPPS